MPGAWDARWVSRQRGRPGLLRGGLFANGRLNLLLVHAHRSGIAPAAGVNRLGEMIKNHEGQNLYMEGIYLRAMYLTDFEYNVIFWVLTLFPISGICLALFSKRPNQKDAGVIMFILSLTVLIVYFKLVS